MSLETGTFKKRYRSLRPLHGPVEPRNVSNYRKREGRRDRQNPTRGRTQGRREGGRTHLYHCLYYVRSRPSHLRPSHLNHCGIDSRSPGWRSQSVRNLTPDDGDEGKVQGTIYRTSLSPSFGTKGPRRRNGESVWESKGVIVKSSFTLQRVESINRFPTRTPVCNHVFPGV